MFNGNQKLIIERSVDYDEYGQRIFFKTFISFGSIAKLGYVREQSSLRGDLSSANGNAYENVANTIILAQISPSIEIGDKLTIVNFPLKVESKVLRYDVKGRAHHLELGCSIWAM